MRDHYLCTAFARDKSEKGCHKAIMAAWRDTKKLKKAGWEHDGNCNRDRWKCPACKPKKERKLTPVEKRVAKLQHNRGMGDAVAGHSPSHLYGPYKKGYVEGLSLLAQIGHDDAWERVLARSKEIRKK
jgi:hypothetical protein